MSARRIHSKARIVSRGTAVGLAALLMALGSGAYATIPDSAGVFTGCQKQGGALRVIDAEAGETCKNNETELSWNQEGPQGPEGPPGPEGPRGPEGPPGPSGGGVTVHSGLLEDGPELVTNNGEFQTVATMIVPLGKTYTISAELTMVGTLHGCCVDNDTGAAGECQLIGDGDDVDRSHYLVPPVSVGSIIKKTTIPLQVVTTFPESDHLVDFGEISLECRAGATTTSRVFTEWIRITAIEADSLSDAPIISGDDLS